MTSSDCSVTVFILNPSYLFGMISLLSQAKLGYPYKLATWK